MNFAFFNFCISGGVEILKIEIRVGVKILDGFYLVGFQLYEMVMLRFL